MDKHIECGLYEDFSKYGDMLPGEWAASKGIKNFMVVGAGVGVEYGDFERVDMNVMVLYSTTLTKDEAKDACRKAASAIASEDEDSSVFFIHINNEGVYNIGGLHLPQVLIDRLENDEGFKMKLCFFTAFKLGIHHLMMIHDKKDGDKIKKLIMSV